MKAVHDQIRDIMCKQCDFATYTKGELNKHVRELHLDIKDHKCDYCSESFHRIKKMIVSLVSKHDNETNKKHVCQFCKYSTPFPKSLDQPKLEIFIRSLNLEPSLFLGQSPKIYDFGAKYEGFI